MIRPSDTPHLKTASSNVLGQILLELGLIIRPIRQASTNIPERPGRWSKPISTSSDSNTIRFLIQSHARWFTLDVQRITRDAFDAWDDGSRYVGFFTRDDRSGPQTEYLDRKRHHNRITDDTLDFQGRSESTAHTHGSSGHNHLDRDPREL